MKNESETIFDKAKKIALEPDERARIKDEVVLFMEQNQVSTPDDFSTAKPEPVRKGGFSRLNCYNLTYAIKSAFYPALSYINRPMPILLIIALLVSGSASLAAEIALPGQVLYPVKVNVNEPVKGWFAFSDQAQAEWETQLAVERLEEAEELASKNKLDKLGAQIQTELETRFEAHAAKVAEGIDKLKSKQDFKTAIETASNFEALLKVHEKILLQLTPLDISLAPERSSGGDPAQASVLPLASKVSFQVDVINKDKSELEVKISGQADTETKAAAEGKLKAAEHKIAEVSQFLKKTYSAENLEDVAETYAQAHLETANGLVADGKVKLEAGSYNEAFLMFQKAHQAAQEIKLLIAARKELAIDIVPKSSTKMFDFEDCARYYPVMESYPRQCRTPDGRLFVENIGEPKPKLTPVPTIIPGSPHLDKLSPTSGAIGTKVVLSGNGLKGVDTIVFNPIGIGILPVDGFLREFQVKDDKTLEFKVPRFLHSCLSDEACLSGLQTVAPGKYGISVLRDHTQSNSLFFVVTEDKPVPTPTPVNNQGTTIIYTNNGYSPTTLTIKKGQRVIWKNESSAPMWTASAVHPTHQAYPGTDIAYCGALSVAPMFDACAGLSAGQSWSFNFDYFVGSWKYHNHLNPAHTGTIVVE